MAEPALSPLGDLSFSAAVGPARGLIVLLHGHGGDSGDLAATARRLSSAHPTLALLALRGPISVMPKGFSWYPLDSRCETQRATLVSKSLIGLRTRIDPALAALGLDRSRLGILGFSQGATMALAMVSEYDPPGAVVAIAGRPVLPPAPARALSTGQPCRILILQGARDGVVPPDQSQRALEMARQAGYPADLHVTPGLGHRVTAHQITLAAAHFQRLGLNTLWQ